MKRKILTLAEGGDARRLDELVARFTAQLANVSDECVFYTRDLDAGPLARVIETETQETLDRFVAFVEPHMRTR